MDVSAVSKIEVYRLGVNNYDIRHEILQGREYLVVPVVMLKEGVHRGSLGPVLYRSEDLALNPSSWDGIPIVIRHPEKEGEYVTANSPEIMEGQTTGRIYNTIFEGGKLKAEAWIEKDRIQQVSPEALAYINQMRPLDVSTGMVFDYEVVTGKWEGEDYEAITHNYRPDHLALLPGEEGACSWADGCGIRANQKQGEDDVKTTKESIKALILEGYSVFQVNRQGYKDICRKIQGKLDLRDTSERYYHLQEVFDDDNFIYEVVTSDGGQGSLFEQAYTADTNGNVEFTGEPIPVTRTVEYVQTNKEGGSGMAEKKKGCCPEQVDIIVLSKHTRFDDGDREYLEGLEEKALVKLLPIEPDPPKEVQVNKEQAIQVLKDQLKTPDQFMALLSPEMRGQMQYGLGLYTEERGKLTERVSANSDYSVEDLKGKPIQELQKLSSLIKTPADYSPMGGGGGENAKPVAMVSPVGVTDN